jgi:hypothetical protein
LLLPSGQPYFYFFKLWEKDRKRKWGKSCILIKRILYRHAVTKYAPWAIDLWQNGDLKDSDTRILANSPVNMIEISSSKHGTQNG